MSFKKLGLIVGNAKYPESLLENPTHDANDLSEKLKSLGFTIITGTDVTGEEFDRLLDNFKTTLNNFDVGLFFFAGHGMQIQGENYITCINTGFDDEIKAKHTSLPLNRIIDILDKGTNRTSIIILDACRNNPYERAWARGITQRGLAPVYAPRGTIIAYATSPGELASDGLGRNGAFTSGVLKHIDDQNLPIEEMFKRVRNTVNVITKGKQTTWEHTSLMGSFSFNSSIPDEQKVAVYSEDAKEDAKFLLQGSDVHRLIGALKSHDWYKQNPAIEKISHTDFCSTDKNTLFILGRNIYQVACGTSSSALEYVKNLEINLNKLNAEISFHILNGMLFEIYFNSSSKFRDMPKAEYFNEVLNMENVQAYLKSFEFIQAELKPHVDNLFYIPGIKKDIALDIGTSVGTGGEILITEICLEAENVLFEDTRDIFYVEGQEKSYKKYTKVKLKEMLSTTMLIPNYRLKINFATDIQDENEIYFPNCYKISKIRT